MRKVCIAALVAVEFGRSAVLLPVHAVDVPHQLAFCLPSLYQLVESFVIVLACVYNRIAVLVKVGIIIVCMDDVAMLVLGIDFMQDVPLLVIWAYIVVDKEIDACGEDVFGRLLEEVVRAPAPTLAFLQGFHQRHGRFGRFTDGVDVVVLNRVDTTGVFDIDEVDDVEGSMFRQVNQSLVLLEMIEELACEYRELVVVDTHGPPFG